MLDIGPPLPERGRYAAFCREINRLKDAVRMLQPVASENILTGVTSIGTYREALPSVGKPGVAATGKGYRVKQVLDDYLRCREFDGTTEGSSDILIAKPFNLRKTGWDGVTVQYAMEPFPGAPLTLSILYSYVTATYRQASITAGGLTGTEHEVIIPRYVPDFSVIFGLQIENGTGVAAAADIIDENTDGRAWGRVV